MARFSGLPVGMRVARQFQRAAFNVKQSEFYKVSTDSWREIDVSAHLEVEFKAPKKQSPNKEHHAKLEVYAVCECKNNRQASRPWIIFTDANSEAVRDKQLLSVIGSDLAHTLFFTFYLDDDLLKDDLVLFRKRRIGYGATCALINENSGRENAHDPAYKAITQVLSAANAKAEAKSDFWQPFRIIFPVIVISAPLFEAFLDEASEVQVQARDEMTVLATNPGARLTESLVHIVTEAKLPEFVMRIRQVFEILHNYTSKMLDILDSQKR